MIISINLAIVSIFSWAALNATSKGAGASVVVLAGILWPEYLRIPVGPIQLSCPRIVAMIFVIAYWRQFRESQKNTKIDMLVIYSYVWGMVATVVAGSQMDWIGTNIGRGMDTVLMYFVGRIAFRSRKDALQFCKGIATCALIAGALGVVESVYEVSPYKILRQHSQIMGLGFDKGDEYRYGYLRAQGSTLVHIYYGLAMFLLACFLNGAKKTFKENRVLFTLSFYFAVAGTISSLSSGPIISMAFALAAFQLHKYPQAIKPLLYASFIFLLLIQLAKGRSIFYFAEYLGADPATSWYRARLIDVAVNNLSEYWLVGAGGRDPHHWGAQIDGRLHVDIVNNFIIEALRSGLVGFYLFLKIHLDTIVCGYRVYMSERPHWQRDMGYALAVLVLSLIIASLTVGVFGPAVHLMFIAFGAVVSLATPLNISQLKNSGVVSRD